MVNIDIILQARMGSSRLPEKTLMEIEGKPMLFHVMQRMNASKLAQRTIIITTELPQDDVIVEFAKENNILFFRGSENDVIDRYYQAAKQFQTDVIVRATADDPLKDPRIIDKVIQTFLDNPDVDYVSNTMEPSYPEGIDIEVLSFKALERACNECKDPFFREHVTHEITKNRDKYKTINVSQGIDQSSMRWTVDHPEDMEFAKAIYKHLYKPGEIFYMEDILKLLKEHPEIAELNKNIKPRQSWIAK
tara:strand:+ start:624 stop:1367 length:744 start_codon:yes stop_codon:yes gene_type:complete